MQKQLSTLLITMTTIILLWDLAGPSFAYPDLMARPTRPKVFSSPDELRAYLDQLSNFYAIAGRPRFGKRNLAPWMAEYIQGVPDERPIPVSPNEIIQMLSSANTPEN